MRHARAPDISGTRREPVGVGSPPCRGLPSKISDHGIAVSSCRKEARTGRRTVARFADRIKHVSSSALFDDRGRRVGSAAGNAWLRRIDRPGSVAGHAPGPAGTLAGIQRRIRSWRTRRGPVSSPPVDGGASVRGTLGERAFEMREPDASMSTSGFASMSMSTMADGDGIRLPGRAPHGGSQG